MISVTWEDIDYKWRDSPLCDGTSLNVRQLRRDRERIFELYDIEIQPRRVDSGVYCYHVANRDKIAPLQVVWSGRKVTSDAPAHFVPFSLDKRNCSLIKKIIKLICSPPTVWGVVLHNILLIFTIVYSKSSEINFFLYICIAQLAWARQTVTSLSHST